MIPYDIQCAPVRTELAIVALGVSQQTSLMENPANEYKVGQLIFSCLNKIFAVSIQRKAFILAFLLIRYRQKYCQEVGDHSKLIRHLRNGLGTCLGLCLHHNNKHLPKQANRSWSLWNLSDWTSGSLAFDISNKRMNGSAKERAIISVLVHI